jgi:ankyrin repeat protein
MPIHWAAQEGNLRAVQQLLEVRSPFDKPNHEDITPLMYAISSGNAEVVKLLLQAGASVDSRVIRHAVDMEEPTILVLLTGGKPKNLIPVRPSATNSNRLESAPEISKRTLLSKIKGFTRKKKEHLQIHTQSLQRQVSL